MHTINQWNIKRELIHVKQRLTVQATSLLGLLALKTKSLAETDPGFSGGSSYFVKFFFHDYEVIA